MPAVLEPHPTSPPTPGIALEAELDRDEGGDLHVRFRLRAPLDDLVLPALAEPRFRLGLWEHTCFEAFVAAEGGEAYHEFNLSSSGEWAVLSFGAYRERRAELRDPALDPAIRTRTGTGLVELAATLRLRSPDLAGHPLAVGLAAVLESRTAPRSYWAVHHPAGPPDFHHPRSRCLHLRPAASTGGDAPDSARTR